MSIRRWAFIIARDRDAGRTCDVFRAVGTRHGHRGRQGFLQRGGPRRGCHGPQRGDERGHERDHLGFRHLQRRRIFHQAPIASRPSLEGFQTSIAEGVMRHAGRRRRASISRLSAGGVTSEIKVTADATQLHTEDARSATAVSNKLIDELPLVVGGAMRSPFDLISTVPEAQRQRRHRVARRRPGRRVRRDARRRLGEHEPQCRHRGDGVPDAVAGSDHRVLGRDERVQAGVRSGRRRRDYVCLQVGHERPARLGLRVPSQRRARPRGFFERTKGIYKQNDYGGSLGGPVRIPRLYDGTNQHVLLRVVRGLPSTVRAATPRSRACRLRRCGTATSPTGSTPRAGGWSSTIRRRRGRTRTGRGSSAIRSRTTRFRWSRFSTVAKQYIALARGRARAESPGARAGHLRLREQQLSSPKTGARIETTQKFSLKIDHTLSSRHRLAYVFNRTGNSIVAGENGATGLPAPFSGFQQSTLRRRSPSRELGRGRRADRESPVDRREHVQQERVFAERRSGLEGRACVFPTRSTAIRTWA